MEEEVKKLEEYLEILFHIIPLVDIEEISKMIIFLKKINDNINFEKKLNVVFSNIKESYYESEYGLDIDTNILERIIKDEIFKKKSDKNNKDTLIIIKLIDCRNNNLDFELELANMIIGDNKNFPYKSSYYITKFFKILGYDFVHDSSTRNRWVANILDKIETKELYTNIIQKGLFDANYYYEWCKNQNIENVDDFINKAKNEFKNLIEKSSKRYLAININDCFDLNINTELLFNNDVKTDDTDLNNYMNTAKKYFIEEDKQTAIEKLWHTFERIKTLIKGKDKSDSADKLIKLISTDIKDEDFRKEFKNLTDIGNAYLIRHSETKQIPIYDNQTLNYLFFRMFSLLNLCISKIQNQNKDK